MLLLALSPAVRAFLHSSPVRTLVRGLRQFLRTQLVWTLLVPPEATWCRNTRMSKVNKGLPGARSSYCSSVDSTVGKIEGGFQHLRASRPTDIIIIGRGMTEGSPALQGPFHVDSLGYNPSALGHCFEGIG